MTKAVEFFFDFGSPATYLAWTQIQALADRCNAEIQWRPMLLGGVFKASGNQSPVTVPAKGAYMLDDLARFARRYDVEMQFNPHFPVNTLMLMRGAVAYQNSERFHDYLQAVFRALWVDGKNLNEPEVVSEVLAAAGFDTDEFLSLCSSDEVKTTLKTNTEEAVERGVFGAPTMFVGQEMFFGQDRLDFVEAALEVQ